MKLAAGIAIGITITLAWTAINPPQPEYRTEVIERTIVEEILTTIDLERLKDDIDNLDQELRFECIRMIIRKTGDPEQGVINHIDRHYQGDACAAAEEAMSGNW